MKTFKKTFYVSCLFALTALSSCAHRDKDIADAERMGSTDSRTSYTEEAEGAAITRAAATQGECSFHTRSYFEHFVLCAILNY